jgi:hypothetical protein
MKADVEANFNQLEYQSSEAATKYMDTAKGAIDKLFGADYAQKHPDLVGAFMLTASNDFG